MERTDNYQISRDRAQAYFLGFDQNAMIEAWSLAFDEAWLYVSFLGKPYKICRTSGTVIRCWDGQAGNFEETLSIFDLLCHESPSKFLSGHFAPVNSLKGRPRAIGVGTDFHSDIAAIFDRDPEAFRRACLTLGGTPMELGDMGFSFPLFAGMTLRLKFYRSDEDFPASVVILWDENTLQYLFYETTFYVAGFLLKAIESQM